MRLVQGMAYASDNHVTKNMLYEATDQKIGQETARETLRRLRKSSLGCAV